MENINFTKTDENASRTKVIDMTDMVRGLFEGFLDEETKSLVNNLSKTEDVGERMNSLKNYYQKVNKKEKEEVVSSSVNDLVERTKVLDTEVSTLDRSQRKEYYAKLHEIPTDKDLHIKLDLILEKLDDVSTELAIMRRHISKA